MLIWVTFGTLNYGEVFAKADASVSTNLFTSRSRSSSWARAGAAPPAPSPGCAMGGPDPGLGPHPRRDHGDRGRLHGGALPHKLFEETALELL